MRFLYHELAGVNSIEITNERYRHIFKARRGKVGDTISLRNLKDDLIHSYEVVSVTKKEAKVKLISSKSLKIEPKRYFHLGWCVIEPKVIEKTLPFLNELGVGKISFIYCDRSQKNFRVDFERLKRIAINSCEQCGRSSLMEFEVMNSLNEYLEKYPQSAILDFGGKDIKNIDDIDSIVIGCEGGFSTKERETFKEKDVYKIGSSIVLRSETAAVYVASAIS